jgi:prepilin-type N-terminal cleavage/methylation domain-containing protein
MRSLPNRGLTLLELVLAVAILGVLAVLVLSSLTVGARGFMSSRADVETTQRARLALTRLAVDLRGLTGVTQAQNFSLTCTDKDGATITVARSGATLTLNDNLLIENLGTYPGGTSLFTYRRADRATAWTTADTLDQLYEIVITLRLNRSRDPVAGGVAHTFTATLNPRNTGAANIP